MVEALPVGVTSLQPSKNEEVTQTEARRGITKVTLGEEKSQEMRELLGEGVLTERKRIKRRRWRQKGKRRRK